MATKISDLTTVTTPASTDQFEINQGGTSFKTTRAQIHTLESGESITGENANAPAFVDEAASATNPTLIPDKSDLDTGVGHNAADELSLVAGGVEVVRYVEATGITVINQITAGITASTTQTQGQGALTASVNEVSTVANADDTVTLPTAVAGLTVEIINNGANRLRIFPASGDDAGNGANAAVTLLSGGTARWRAYDATNWTQVYQWPQPTADASRNSTDITHNTTSWVDVDTGLDLVLPATVGDMVGVNFSAAISNEAVTIWLDAISTGGAASANWSLGGAESGTGRGVQAWRGNTSVIDSVGGEVVRALVANDLSNGTLTVRFRMRCNTATTKTILAGTGGETVNVSATNYG